jgi:hypothetical protein
VELELIFFRYIQVQPKPVDLVRQLPTGQRRPFEPLVEQDIDAHSPNSSTTISMDVTVINRMTPTTSKTKNGNANKVAPTAARWPPRSGRVAAHEDNADRPHEQPQ